MEHQLKIVNPQMNFQKVLLVKPTNHYYLHIAAEIDHSPLPFFYFTSKKKKLLIDLAKSWCAQLQKEAGVISAIVFRALLIPPGKGKLLKEQPGKVQVANYDFAILIETDTADQIEILKQTSGYENIISRINRIAKKSAIVTATNVRRIGPVDHDRKGVFLFNYFFADELERNLNVWEYTAGWFQQETGLDNSTVLQPVGDTQSKYTIINHCRWDSLGDILPSLLFKRSFHSYVLDNFYANNVAAMPVLFKMA